MVCVPHGDPLLEEGVMLKSVTVAWFVTVILLLIKWGVDDYRFKQNDDRIKELEARNAQLIDLLKKERP